MTGYSWNRAVVVVFILVHIFLGACEYLRIYQRSNNKHLAVNRNTNQLHDIRCYMILYIYVHIDCSRACYDFVSNPALPKMTYQLSEHCLPIQLFV